MIRLDAVQVNLQKARLASQLLQDKVQSNLFLAFITEPYTVANKVVFRPTGYQIIPPATLDSTPRAALYIPRNIQAIELSHLCTPDCAAARIKWHGKDVLIVSGYMDYDLPVVSEWLLNIVQYVQRTNMSLLLSVDSNAHSSFYSTANTNLRGKHFEDFIVRNMLKVENVGDVPTFQCERANSVIDVTLTKKFSVWNWHVDQEFNASDHNSIYFQLEADPVPEREVRPWQKADWRKFTDTLDKARPIPERMTCKKLDNELNKLYNDINIALEAACPKFKAKWKPKKTEWYSDKIAALHFKVKKQYRKAMSTEVRDEFDKYETLRKKFRRRCRRAKAITWRKFVVETPGEHKMAVLSRIALHKDRQNLNVLYNTDGSVTEPGLETIDRLAQVHFPQAIPHQQFPGYTSDRAERSEVIQQKYLEYVTPKLVRRSLLKFKPFKAPGPDELKPVIFRYLPPSVITFLTFLFQSCLHLRYTPRKWQEATVVFIPKAGKKDPRECKAHRPIVLSNFFLKALERLITWRMDDHLRYYPIHPLQHGFQIGKGTEAALSNTCDYIEQFVLKRKYCLGVFLDISSAYDSMDISHIRDSLYLHGGDEDLVEWYYQYLSHRVLHVPLHGERRSLSCSQGFPQGGVASAKFWIIAFNPAIEIINRQFTVGNGYADDLSVVFGGTHPDDLVERMQRVIDELVLWGESCNLTFNPEKTVMVGFTRATKHIFTLPIHIKGVPLKFVDTVKYLGLLLDKKLKWRPHIMNKIAICKQYLMKMANIAHTTWGPKPHLMRWMYRCMVRTKFTYAALVWFSAAQSLSMQKKLRRLNRIAINTYATVHRSTPSRGLEIMTDTFPLHLYLRKEAVCSYIRLKNVLTLRWTGLDRRNPHLLSHLLALQRETITLGVNNAMHNVDTCDMGRPDVHFVICNNTFRNRDAYIPFLDSSCCIFTDGSKHDGRVGSAYVIMFSNDVVKTDQFRLPDSCSVYQAELYAIHQAALFASLHDFDMDITFLSDSQAALQALQSDRITSRVVLDTIRALDNLNGDINLVWVPAHAGIFGNEKADELAKAAANDIYVHEMPLPKTAVKGIVLTALREIWNDEWNTYPDARMTKYFFPRQCALKSKKICKLSRLQLGRFVRIITGHNNLRYYQSKLDINVSAYCRFCLQQPETFHHFVFECPSLHFSRQRIFLDCLPNVQMNWDVDKLLAFSYLPHINSLLDPNSVHDIRLEDTDSEPEQNDVEEVDDPNLSESL